MEGKRKNKMRTSHLTRHTREMLRVTHLQWRMPGPQLLSTRLKAQKQGQPPLVPDARLDRVRLQHGMVLSPASLMKPELAAAIHRSMRL